MKLDVKELFPFDICTIDPTMAYGSKELTFKDRKCEFLKITKAGLVEVQVWNTKIRDSFPRDYISEYIEYPRKFLYYNAEYESEIDAIEIESDCVHLDDVAVEAAKSYAGEQPEGATLPIAIMLIDAKKEKHLFEVQCDITYDYYASEVDY